jgi:hypothetical protein
LRIQLEALARAADRDSRRLGAAIITQPSFVAVLGNTLNLLPAVRKPVHSVAAAAPTNRGTLSVVHFTLMAIRRARDAVMVPPTMSVSAVTSIVCGVLATNV